MNEGEALMEIQRMDIGQKMAALSPTDKAYIKGYIERAVLEIASPSEAGREKRKMRDEGLRKEQTSLKFDIFPCLLAFSPCQ